MASDPIAADTGYLISEEDEFEARTLLQSMHAISALYDNQAVESEEHGPTADESAALWRMVADLHEAILKRSRFAVVPKDR